MKTWQINEPFSYFQTTISLDFQNCKKGRKFEYSTIITPKFGQILCCFVKSREIIKHSNLGLFLFYKKWVCRFSKSCKLTFSVWNNQLHPHCLVCFFIFKQKFALSRSKQTAYFMEHVRIRRFRIGWWIWWTSYKT